MEMAEKKYAKYIVQGSDMPIRAPERDGKILTDMITGGADFPETPNWIYAGLVYGAGTGFGFGDMMELTLPDGNKERWQTGPHAHTKAETYVFLGTDPSKPRDLCAEVELWLGQGEDAEKYTLTKSTTIFVPPNLVHCPVWAKRVDRPFVFMAVMADPEGSRETCDFPFPPGFSKTV